MGAPPVLLEALTLAVEVDLFLAQMLTTTHEQVAVQSRPRGPRRQPNSTAAI